MVHTFWVKVPLYVTCLLLCITVRPICRAQATYYVAINGSDVNSGRSAGAPFQTLAKINSLALQPGDSILFRRGDTFRGNLTIKRSGQAGKPIVIDAYGSGAKPVLAGSVPVTGWTAVGNNMWQANCPQCGPEVTGLYRNGTTLPLGRYPNPDAVSRGYLTVQAHVGNLQLTSQQPLSVNWTGGEVVVRPTYWIIDRARITRQSANVLTLANPSSYQFTDGWGFFIQNHPATLDQPGEWYYNPANKTIRLYDPAGNPGRYLITATTTSRGIDLVNASFITLRNLHVTETLNEALLATNASDLTVVSTDFTNAGEDGVIITGSGRNVLIENCRIHDVNNNGFVIGSHQSLTFRGNSLRRIGVLPGRGKSGDGEYNALQTLANQALIENNVIDSIGYNGISFWNNTIIRQNRISNFCMTKADGGGLYVWNGKHLPMSNIKIASNIIYRGIGIPGGVADTRLSGAHGVFFRRLRGGH